jgi:hypothetical protein
MRLQQGLESRLFARPTGMEDDVSKIRAQELGFGMPGCWVQDPRWVVQRGRLPNV